MVVTRPTTIGWAQMVLRRPIRPFGNLNTGISTTRGRCVGSGGVHWLAASLLIGSRSSRSTAAGAASESHRLPLVLLTPNGLRPNYDTR